MGYLDRRRAKTDCPVDAHDWSDHADPMRIDPLEMYPCEN